MTHFSRAPWGELENILKIGRHIWKLQVNRNQRVKKINQERERNDVLSGFPNSRVSASRSPLIIWLLDI